MPVKRNTKDLLVYKRERGWAVQRSTSLRAMRLFSTKEEATAFARKYRSMGLDVFIFTAKGSIDQVMPAKKAR